MRFISNTAGKFVLKKSNTLSFIIGISIGLSVIQFDLISTVIYSVFSGGIFYTIQELI